jgi:hypothetical protein
MSHRHAHQGNAGGATIAGTSDVAAVADTIRQWLADADRILIGAGAGLSAAAGYDYSDTRRFAELFPALQRLGLRAAISSSAPRCHPSCCGATGPPTSPTSASAPARIRSTSTYVPSSAVPTTSS